MRKFKNIKTSTKKNTSGKGREKVGKKQEFPNIYRIFTESFISLKSRLERLDLSRIFIACLILLILLAVAGTILTSLDLYKNNQKKQKIEAEREKLTTELKQWQGIAGKYKGYRDAYFKLAVLSFQLKDFDRSKFYLMQVFSLDPNFQAGRDLEKMLKK